MKISPLDRGIEEIQWQNEGERALLDTPSLVPGDAPIESPLDEILALPGFSDRIAESLVPQITHRHILQPAAFQSLTQHLPARMQAVAEGAETPQLKRTFLAAVDVLEEQRQNTEILNAYRKLLLKG